VTSDVVALQVAQAAERAHGRAVADFLHLRPAQVVLQLRRDDTRMVRFATTTAN
jgi:hypothetical protein